MTHETSRRRAIMERDQAIQRAEKAERQRDELLAACKAIRGALNYDAEIKLSGTLIGSLVFDSAARAVDDAIAKVEGEK